MIRIMKSIPTDTTQIDALPIGTRYFHYATALDRGGVVRLVVEERVKTSVGSIRAATHRTALAWHNNPDNRVIADRLASSLNDEGFQRDIPAGIEILGTVRRRVSNTGQKYEAA